MSFNEKYELLVPLRDDGIKTFVARDVNSGRALEVHLFLSGRTAESTALVERLNTLPAEARALVLEIGEHNDIPYVVTDMLPKRQSLRDWVRLFPVPASQIPTEEFPAFRITPADTASAALQKGETLPPFRMPPRNRIDKGETLPPFRVSARPAIEKGETLPPFRPPGADFLAKGETLPPFRMPSLPFREETNVPTAAGVPSNRDEDFLKLFQVPSREKPGTSMSSVPAAPQTLPAPGEFTSLFSVPAPTAPGAPQSPLLFHPPASPPGNSTPELSPPRSPQTNSSGPGEFTRLVSAPVSVTPSPMPQDPVRAEQPPVPDVAKPGEFTRMFSTPAGGAAPPAREFRFQTSAPQGGNPPAGGLPPANLFTHTPAPSVRPDSQPSEVTRMAGGPHSAPPPANVPSSSSPTPVLATPPATSAGAPVEPQAPSAHTRLFASTPRLGDVLGLNSPPANGGGLPPQMEMPSVPQFPQAPQTPQFPPRPQTSRIFQLPEERSQKSSVLPYVLLAVAFVLALALVILLAARA